MSSHSKQLRFHPSMKIPKPGERRGKEKAEKETDIEGHQWPTFGHFIEQSVSLGDNPNARPSPKIRPTVIRYLKSCQHKCEASHNIKILHTTLKSPHTHWHDILCSATAGWRPCCSHTAKHETDEAARTHTGKEAWCFAHTCITLMYTWNTHLQSVLSERDEWIRAPCYSNVTAASTPELHCCQTMEVWLCPYSMNK